MTLRTLNYGNYGIFLIMGNAGLCPSTVCARMPATRTENSPKCINTDLMRYIQNISDKKQRTWQQQKAEKVRKRSRRTEHMGLNN